VDDKEKEYREKITRFADMIGAREDLDQLLKKWDAIIPLAPPKERKQMALMAILEVERLLDIHSELRDGLEVDGEIIIPANVGWRNS
jgi:hypothetical protein